MGEHTLEHRLKWTPSWIIPWATVNTQSISMTNQAKVKIYAVKSRHTINLPREFVRDSAFPFKVGEELVAKIDERKIIIEKNDYPSPLAPLTDSFAASIATLTLSIASSSRASW